KSANRKPTRARRAMPPRRRRRASGLRSKVGPRLGRAGLERRDQAVAVPDLAPGAEAGGLGVGDRVFIARRQDPVLVDDVAGNVVAADAVGLVWGGHCELLYANSGSSPSSLGHRCAAAR